MANAEKIMVTAEGYLDLENELNELKNVRRPQIIQAIKEARALGDLSENADYDAARDEQAQVESRIKELEYKLEHSEIIENKKKSHVGLGSKVVIKYDDGEEDEYMIVGSLEADPFNNRISNESPIGVAVMGKKQGDVVSVASPNGSYEVTIKEIK
ncbi:MAG: transcription elongation factor GreA [Bacilli bacterium]|nr:transcription elongation factor GreA [Bacilli bacterium]